MKATTMTDAPYPAEMPTVNRRRWLLSSLTVTGGFALGLKAPAEAQAQGVTSGLRSAGPVNPLQAGAALNGGATALTDWVRITRDNQVTLIVGQAEMGQGISTTLPAALCDELDADWSRVAFELAPTALPYRNPRIQWQFTGNSESLQSFLVMIRRIGATARTLLVTAAAQQWQVPPAELTVSQGRVLHAASGRALTFGELAEAAARLPVPQDVALKPDSQLKLLGKSLPRVDGPIKASGRADYGIDYIPPGLERVAHAAIRTAPAYGGAPRSIRNRDALMARRGVIQVVQLPNAVAVVAEKYWQARAAMAAADIEFTDGPHAAMSSQSLRQQYLDRMAQGPVKVAKDEQGEQVGQDAAARASGSAAFEATYELGFQAHATLEPQNALADVGPQGIRIWAPTQGQELTKFAVAGVLQVNPETVQVFRTPFLGGGFGRRLLPDFAIDACLLSRAVGRPVKVIYSREEDFRRDFFRPATLHRLQARLGRDGQPVAVTHRLLSPTILKPVFPPLDLSGGLDPSALEGLLETRYRIPGWRTEFGLMDLPVPTSVYRTTGWGPTIFGLESFIDELAHRAKADPLAFRRRLLAHDERAVRVLDELARRTAWKPRAANAAPARGRGQGMAFTDAFGTLLAQMVEVSVRGNKVRIERIVTVADPGQVLDPDITRAGLDGGAIWALASACKGEVTFDKGAVVQGNFHQYDLLRLRESPRFETHLLQTPGAPLGGVGEVGPVATVPALTNAIFAATGKRLRRLPLSHAGLELA